MWGLKIQRKSNQGLKAAELESYYTELSVEFRGGWQGFRRVWVEGSLHVGDGVVLRLTLIVLYITTPIKTFKINFNGFTK